MIRIENGRLYRRYDNELLCIEPWGPDAFRVRATERAGFLNDDTRQALLPADPVPFDVREEEDGTWRIVNGNLSCEISPSGSLTFRDASGKVLLSEYERTRDMYAGGHAKFNSALEIYPRKFVSIPGTDNYRLAVRFEPADGEKIYGLGQYQQPYLDMKGCTLELAHRNSQASVPFALSSLGYGFLWNNPGIGRVTFGKNVTVWEADSTKEMDYWIGAGQTPADILHRYAAVTGTVPMMPEYGLGFWQCKLRYQTQEELLDVAREYHRRGIPVDVIVADFFHWPHQGDWKFDKDYWPDPAAMVKELEAMGTKLMVSVWPTVDGESENYPAMKEGGMLMRSERGLRLGQLSGAAIADMTNPETRAFVWDKLKKNYYEDGVRIFWLDEAEPEINGEPGRGGYEYDHYRYFAGADLEIGNLYPREYARMTYDGMAEEGQENIVNLLRCAWAGSARYGALVWSGDIDSSFASLRNQLAAGLSMGLAGIPWWTTDIGGFHGGNINDPAFRELFARWFAFGCFCPVMRLHGFREPVKPPIGTSGGGSQVSGAENEIWSYGPEIEEICKTYLALRERLRPYTRQLMAAAHETGDPVIRPLFYGFPEDKTAWSVEDEYLYGPDILVAPVLEAGARERTVYLPASARWVSLWNGTVFEGGQTITAPAPLARIPVFVREGSPVRKLLP